ncbi:MAG: hypothetical protein AUJ76_03460 [Candidatus Omnitrophica bacterium CG1_02_41_171]|nr:MAG: hypothetical protein AUJ76_03460 [Candidatus Omnitrophica bacterium CG1_02_41_171]
MSKKVKRKFIFCQAGNFQQVFLASEEGKIISRDISQVLATIKCSEKTETKKSPKDHNRIAMKIKRSFEEDVKIREAEKEYMIKLRQAQRYVLREIRLQFAKTDDADEKEKIGCVPIFPVRSLFFARRPLHHLNRVTQDWGYYL